MDGLDLPDLCAHLDRLTLLCNRLEQAQSDSERYHDLEEQIRSETDAMRALISRLRPPSRPLTKPASDR